MKDQEISHQKVCLSRSGDATDVDGTDGTLEVAWISVSSQHGDLLLLLFFQPEHALLGTLWQGLQSWERGVYILEGTQLDLA